MNMGCALPVTLVALFLCLPSMTNAQRPQLVGRTLTDAQTPDGKYISWREHRIDDEELSGVAIRGGDGLVMADLDGDGFEDIISVHESDTVYDGVADGHVRIAYGTDDPHRWVLETLAEGPEAGAAEDVAVGDLNGDGDLDVVVACELAHLLYLQNPGQDVARGTAWPRRVPQISQGRGSFIRVFCADLNSDGKLEIVATNKGAQSPDLETIEPRPVSWFSLNGAPLEDDNWVEHELLRMRWPINGQPVDLDGDGDTDVVGGSVAESQLFWCENRSRAGRVDMVTHPIEIAGTSLVGNARPEDERDSERPLVTGFNMDYVDLSGDGRLDIVAAEAFQSLVWLEQPEDPRDPWVLHSVENLAPDELVGLLVVDINEDGSPDILVGGYSRGPRDEDGEVSVDDSLGRLAWFEHPGDLSTGSWIRHDISRRKRGMFDKFIARDLDDDGDIDFVSTRGNSSEYDGVFWLEQVRTDRPVPVFRPARDNDSSEMPLPH